MPAKRESKRASRSTTADSNRSDWVLIWVPNLPNASAMRTAEVSSLSSCLGRLLLLAGDREREREREREAEDAETRGIIEKRENSILIDENN